uniref:Type II secretion system protein GspF domain-containing protein n=1 Tax=Thermofilum pendens TaxID=2269 RepID=A0A7C4BAK0_THEPE
MWKWLRSEADAVPLALILLSSPQLPLTTLRELRRSGFYTYLPDPEELLFDEKKAAEGLSGRMRRVLEAAAAVQRSGRREALEERMRDVLAELRTALEMADYNISNLYTVVSTLASTMASMIVVTLALVGGGAVAAALALSGVAALVSALIGVAVYPLEFSLPAPPWRSYLPLLLAAPLYLLLTHLELPLPLTLSLAAAGTLPALLHLLHTREEVGKLVRAREMVRAAARAAGNPYHTLVREGFINNPENLLKPASSLAAAANLSVHQVLLHGGYELLEKLEDYYSRIVEFVLRLRSKTRVFLLYAVIEAVIVSAVYAFTAAIQPLLAEGGAALAQAGLSLAGIKELEEGVDYILAATALALSTAASSCREGKPLFFTTYLPLLATALAASYLAALQLAPSLIGG